MKKRNRGQEKTDSTKYLHRTEYRSRRRSSTSMDFHPVKAMQEGDEADLWPNEEPGPGKGVTENSLEPFNRVG